MFASVATRKSVGCTKLRESPPGADAAMAPPAPSRTSDVSGMVARSADANADTSPVPDDCLGYRSVSGRRTFGYRLPGDPASHPGCMLDDSGALQCPEDFSNWTPTSKVTVPKNEAAALIDSAETKAMAMGWAKKRALSWLHRVVFSLRDKSDRAPQLPCTREPRRSDFGRSKTA